MIYDRNYPDAQELGHYMAKVCDKSEVIARQMMPDLLPRCATCVVRSGPQTRTDSIETLMILLHCIWDERKYPCGDPSRRNQACSGWTMALFARNPEWWHLVDWVFDTP